MIQRPVIIIGAGRSGTNALRDALCISDALHTWPCDEINYIWRHGNRAFPTDEMLATHATPEVKRFIHEAFEKEQSKAPQATLVEKTCANSLRVEFVHEVFPKAHFVHIIRDGRDVAASAMERWTAELDVPYLLAKAKYVPPSDLPYYATKYLRTRLARLRSTEDRLSWWGPRFAGMDALVEREASLVEVAALQWQRCVALSTEQLKTVPADQVTTIHYQSLVDATRETLKTVFEGAGVEHDARAVDAAAATIRGGSVGKWRSALSTDEIDLIAPIVEPTLAAHGMLS